MRVAEVLIACALVCFTSSSAAQLPRPAQDQGTPSSTGTSPRPNYRECFSGSAAACITEARKSLQNRYQQPTDAIALFSKACELGEIVGCEDVARLYQASGYNDKAQPFVERTAALRKKQSQLPESPRTTQRAPAIFLTSPEGMQILERRVDASKNLRDVGAIFLGAGIVLSLGGLASLPDRRTGASSSCPLCGVVLPGIGLSNFALPGAIMLTVGLVQLARNKRALASARIPVGPLAQEQSQRATEPARAEVEPITHVRDGFYAPRS